MHWRICSSSALISPRNRHIVASCIVIITPNKQIEGSNAVGNKFLKLTI